MTVVFQTNLDLDCADKYSWPKKLDFRPMVGDLVRSSHVWPSGFRLELQVVQVTITQNELIAELHLPPTRWTSVSDFHSRYRKLQSNLIS